MQPRYCNLYNYIHLIAVLSGIRLLIFSSMPAIKIPYFRISVFFHFFVCSDETHRKGVKSDFKHPHANTLTQPAMDVDPDT